MDTSDWLMAISLRLHPRQQVLDVCIQVLLVRFLRDPIHSDGCVIAHPFEGPNKFCLVHQVR
jgi:hypothetical protein